MACCEELRKILREVFQRLVKTAREGCTSVVATRDEIDKEGKQKGFKNGWNVDRKDLYN
jgi:hypothetical protein